MNGLGARRALTARTEGHEHRLRNVYPRGLASRHPSDASVPGVHDETTDGTAEFAARSQHYTALGNSLMQCRFMSEAGWGDQLNEKYRDAMNLALGWELSLEEVKEIGERIYNLERLINVECGVANRKSDTLPYRVMHKPIPNSPSAGIHSWDLRPLIEPLPPIESLSPEPAEDL